ncbi:MAG: glycosyltransferase 87 family protein [Deltaproteobacteria bacterium]|nr:glycosyltransferase 87 family protein [Deltaproteobacteria bacterium]
MTTPASKNYTRRWLAGIAASHVLLLALLIGGSLGQLSFEMSFQPGRPTTIQIFVEGVRGALAGRGLYDARALPPAFGPYDAMASRATPLEIALLGAPFAPLPDGGRFPAWLLVNELALLLAARLIWRRVAHRGAALAFLSAWALGTPYLVSLGVESPQSLAALGLLSAACLEGRGGAAAYAALIALRPFFLGLLFQLIRLRRWPYMLGAAAAIAASALLLALHPDDVMSYLTRHPYGESYPGNLGLQAFLFSALRNLVPDRPLSIPIAGRVIYDLNILTLILMRLAVFALVGLAALLSWRARRSDQIGAVVALWACTWVATGVDVGEADFLLVIAGAAALAARGAGGWVLPAAALWLALPTPYALLPTGGIESWSPEFGWTAAQALALHGFKLVPAAAIYVLAAKRCYRA